MAAIAIRDRLVAVPPAIAPLDVLPGIKAAQITALSNAITTYASGVTAPDEQTNQNPARSTPSWPNVATLAGAAASGAACRRTGVAVAHARRGRHAAGVPAAAGPADGGVSG